MEREVGKIIVENLPKVVFTSIYARNNLQLFKLKSLYKINHVAISRVCQKSFLYMYKFFQIFHVEIYSPMRTNKRIEEVGSGGLEVSGLGLGMGIKGLAGVDGGGVERNYNYFDTIIVIPNKNQWAGVCA